jgi:hypothetical protein
LVLVLLLGQVGLVLPLRLSLLPKLLRLLQHLPSRLLQHLPSRLLQHEPLGLLQHEPLGLLQHEPLGLLQQVAGVLPGHHWHSWG